MTVGHDSSKYEWPNPPISAYYKSFQLPTMRFAVVLATMVGLAVAVPKSPLYKRQCYSQPQGCCLKTTNCQTCYEQTVPFPCNCECLEYGGCPCTGIDYDLDPPQCVLWSAGPDGHC
ncbi:hypothetical protein J3E68DRAFT_263847 [Trichoderma sp. SZMC 28012]